MVDLKDELPGVGEFGELLIIDETGSGTTELNRHQFKEIAVRCQYSRITVITYCQIRYSISYQ